MQEIQSTETVHVYIFVPVSVDWLFLFSRLNLYNMHSESLNKNEVYKMFSSVRASLLRIDFSNISRLRPIKNHTYVCLVFIDLSLALHISLPFEAHCH